MNIGEIVAVTLFLIVIIMGFLLSFYLLRHKRYLPSSLPPRIFRLVVDDLLCSAFTQNALSPVFLCCRPLTMPLVDNFDAIVCQIVDGCP